MSKIELDPINSGYNLSKINSNFQAIEDELNNKVLYRSNPVGEPNSMESDLDMNSRAILNASKISSNILEIGGVQVVPIDLAIDPYNGTRESLRRSYADAGYIMVPGSFEAGGTVTTTTDVLLYEAEGKAYSWGGTLPKVTPAGSTPSSSGGIGASAWIDRSSETLRVKLNANTGATLVRTAGGKTVQQELDKFGVFVSIADYVDLKAAIAALPVFGGTVRIPIGRFQVGDWNYNTDYMSKANVVLDGEKMPSYNNTLTSLEGGSILEGRFNVWADGFAIRNVGFDMGKTVCDAKYPGANFTTASHPLGGTWDAFAFASPNDGSPARKSVNISNVIGILYNSQTLGHAVLCEGIRGGSIDNVVAVYGVLGAVFKVMETKVSGVRSYAQSSNAAIIKSDTYAVCGRSSFSGLLYMPSPVNTTPWSTPAVVTSALNINAGTASFIGATQISDTFSSGATNHVNLTGDLDFADVSITGIVTNGANVTQWSLTSEGVGNKLRVNVGSIICTNAQNVVYCTNSGGTDPHLHIGNIQATNIAGDVIVVGGSGVCTIDNLDVNNAGSVYNLLTSNAKVYVGKENIKGLTGPKFKGQVPALINGWTNFNSGNETFSVSLEGYQAKLAGLIKPGSNQEMVQLAGMLTKTTTRRFPVLGANGATGIEVRPTGVVAVVATIPGLAWVSLDGISLSY